MAYRPTQEQRYHPLPPRPNYQSPAGPSHQSAYRPQAQPYHQPQSQVCSYPNFTGGYPGYPQYSYPYYPTQSYGQSLFTPYPAATPDSYAYSQGYLQQPQPTTTDTAPPAKRQRRDLPNSATGGGIKAWRNCSHPGCKFVGPGEEVEVHEGDRHLIFPKGKHVALSDEEERFAKHKG